MKKREAMLIAILSSCALDFGSASAATRYSVRQPPVAVVARNHVGHELRRTAVFRIDESQPTDIHSTLQLQIDGATVREFVSPNMTTDEPLDFSSAGNIAGHRFSYAVTGERQYRHYYVTGSRAIAYLQGAFVDVHAALATRFDDAASRVISSQSTKVNDRGEVVGRFTVDGPQDFTHAFLYRNGEVLDLGAAGTEFSEAVDINQNSMIAGTRGGADAGRDAFVYAGGGMQNVVPRDAQHTSSMAAALNDAGWVAGTVTTPNGARAFLRGEGLLELGTLGGSESTAADIDGRNRVVGQSRNAAQQPRAFLFEAGRMIDLNSLILPTDAYANLTFEAATAIFEDGVIVAQARNGSQLRNYWLVPVAEPGSTADPAVFNFEGGTQGWQNFGEPIALLSSSHAQPFAGVRSLAVAIEGSGFASIAVPQANIAGHRTITFRIYLPADASLDWLQPFVLEDETSGWRWSGNWQPLSALQRGAWNTLNVAVPNDARPLWALGVEFFVSDPYHGIFYIDSVDH